MVTRSLPAAVMAALLLLTLDPTGALADGQAGLVIQHGDGSIETYCVPFEGDGISGEELLRAAPVTFEQVSGMVCAIGTSPDEGCRGASSLSDCTCQCQGGGDCLYWAYFTRESGGDWVYSSVGFSGQVARDGSLQAWRWGSGGPGTAPTPPDLTFDDVCGGDAGPGRTSPEAAASGGTPASAEEAPPPSERLAGDGESGVSAASPTAASSVSAEPAEGGRPSALTLAIFALAAGAAGLLVVAGARRRRADGR